MRPSGPPRGDRRRVAVAPLGFEGIELRLGIVGVGGGVDRSPATSTRSPGNGDPLLRHAGRRAGLRALAANGGGAILNVLSALSWIPFEGATAYGAAKAAGWSLTDGVRLELAGQGTQVTGLHAGAIDTDMMAGFDVPKSDPADIVRAALDGLEAGSLEVLADDASAQAKASLGAEPGQRYPQTVASA